MITKQEIIDEIIRTAKLNNGNAFGQERFIKETGYKISDWYPYLWLRWSDAIKEAGLVPNKFTTAIEKDFLIQKLVDLIKELGHFPIWGEFRRKAKQDPAFPSYSVFNKLGSKKKLAAAVANYCRSHAELTDVLEICAAFTDDKQISTEPDSIINEKKDGFVYLIKSGRYYKIGWTNSIVRRQNEIRIQMPEESVNIHSIMTDDPSGIEAYWHKRFQAKRKNGEWFELTRADVNAFKRRKNFM